jgi:F0F1-type ATP synthase membrane subunit b/b'
MQELLRQLGQLFLQAIPTVVIVFLFYLFMRPVFFNPILHAMNERKRLTEGAHEEAEKLLGQTREKGKVRQEELKKARMAIYAEHEAARQAILTERTRQLSERRTEAQQEVRVAKARLAAEAVETRASLEEQSPDLAAKIVDNILGGSGTDTAGVR